VSGRLREQRGFGLIELLMAMVMLNIGLLAIIAAFSSGIWGIARAGQISTASALGDAQMELYRGLPNTCIYLISPPSSGVYSTDSAYSASQVLNTTGSPTNATNCTAKITPATLPAKATTASQTVVGPDHHKYEVDTYIVYYCPGQSPSTPPCNGTAGQTTQVTVVVRDGLITSKVFGRQSSVFDPSSG
jgi:type II secretory pathway pseudopilin PulG